MNYLFLVYNPRNWLEPRPLPVDWVACNSKNIVEQADRLTHWNPDFVIICCYDNESGMKTQTDPAGLKLQLQDIQNERNTNDHKLRGQI